jgi:predicted membrane protein
MTPGNQTPGAGGPGNTPPNWRDLRHQERMQRRQWFEQRMTQRGQHPGRIFPGIVLLIIGAVFLLRNLGLFDISEVRMYWPVLLIVVGVAHAISMRHGVRTLVWSGALIVMGGLLLLQNFGYINGNVWEIIWPVWLIFLGVSFMFRGRFGGPGFAGPSPWAGWDSTPSSANRLNEHTMFGGIKQRVDSQEFEGGYLSSVFGGIEVDLRQANTKLDELVIEANAVFGGIDLLLPDRWNITVRGAGVFGGYEDKTHPPAGAPNEKRPHLIVTGSAVFGGVTVRN